MTVTAELERQSARAAQLAIVDCDIHPVVKTPTELHPYLPERWRTHLKRYGTRVPQPLSGTVGYPRMNLGNGRRLDSWPPDGGPPVRRAESARSRRLARARARSRTPARLPSSSSGRVARAPCVPARATLVPRRPGRGRPFPRAHPSRTPCPVPLHPEAGSSGPPTGCRGAQRSTLERTPALRRARCRGR